MMKGNSYPGSCGPDETREDALLIGSVASSPSRPGWRGPMRCMVSALARNYQAQGLKLSKHFASNLSCA
jgi:hypothetical protein